jgi:hypothetical protein
VWAALARKILFPNPFPDGFYGGAEQMEPFVGQRQNYYAWEWGDALFVVLDPYWYSCVKPDKNGDYWSMTLGREQYDWLHSVLGKSRQRWKFVFCHNLVGGLYADGHWRGGAEAAGDFELGGRNQDGSWGFDIHRPGWGQPIHQLLIQYRVNIFFHGHDHFYARQELDGVIYQLLPQPNVPKFTLGSKPAQYSYRSGTILPGSGYLAVAVTDSAVRIDYVLTLRPEDETDSAKNGTIADSYSLYTGSPTKTLRVPELSPRLLRLEQNHPNPFNEETELSYILADADLVRLQVFDLLGRVIDTLEDGWQVAGEHRCHWSARDLASGVYWCVLRGEGFVLRKKMVVLH